MLEGCCCFGIRTLRLVPDCHFRNRFHKRLFTSRFPPPWSNEKLPQPLARLRARLDLCPKCAAARHPPGHPTATCHTHRQSGAPDRIRQYQKTERRSGLPVHASGLWSDSDSHARGAILDRMLSRPRSRSLPNFIEPCLPRRADKPPAGRDWIHEIKHDGFRIMARRVGERVRLYTRNGYDFADRFPQIVEANLKPTDTVLFHRRRGHRGRCARPVDLRAPALPAS